MAELETTNWSTEWETRGAVVLPQRRRPLWWRAALALFLVANSSLQLIDNLRDDESIILTVLIGIGLPFLAWFLGYTIWQLITRRPLLRIDHAGVHYGTSSRMRIPWDRVDTISDPIGKWLFAYVNVRPYDEKPRRLPISHIYVDDLRPFAIWLRARLEEERRSAGR
ncbi:hypothetical protein OG474_22775 [Kribbella sp. NBC_01505]|uniref:hypothetical protein n=1 Tax=Kribbella sp. NBC_01505 TaxID=2903580 RepID=UPI00386D81E6